MRKERKVGMERRVMSGEWGGRERHDRVLEGEREKDWEREEM